ncbi:unnamed protein product [Urochloa humidicola]
MAPAAAEEPDVLEYTSSTRPTPTTSAASPSLAATTWASSPRPAAIPSPGRREDEGLRSPGAQYSVAIVEHNNKRRAAEETRSPRDLFGNNDDGQPDAEQEAMAPHAADEADARAVFEFHKTRGGVRGLVESGVASVPPLFVAPVPPVSSAAFAAPSVDLSLPRAQDAALVRAAARSCSIFKVTNHGVPAGAIGAALAAVAAFNEQPFAARSAHYCPTPIGAITYATVPIPRPRGVTQATATTPLLCWRDSLVVRFDCSRDSGLRSIPALCRDALLDYHQSMARLGSELTGLLLEGLGVKAERLGQIQGCLMQCHYHPPCPEPERVLGSREHTDADLFTVLAEDEVGGLQVRLDDGDGEWMDVPPVAGALTVNIGDLLKVLSNDEYKSVEHRVVIKSAQEPRVSMALFFAPVKHSKTDFFSPFPELVTAENPAQYRTLTRLEMLANRTVLGHAKPSSLDEFRVTSN